MKYLLTDYLITTLLAIFVMALALYFGLYLMFTFALFLFAVASRWTLIEWRRRNRASK